jgi:hypothetical protein
LPVIEAQVPKVSGSLVEDPLTLETVVPEKLGSPWMLR